MIASILMAAGCSAHSPPARAGSANSTRISTRSTSIRSPTTIPEPISNFRCARCSWRDRRPLREMQTCGCGQRPCCCSIMPRAGRDPYWPGSCMVRARSRADPGWTPAISPARCARAWSPAARASSLPRSARSSTCSRRWRQRCDVRRAPRGRLGARRAARSTRPAGASTQRAIAVPRLRTAGVVDAGGLAIVLLLEGMSDLLATGSRASMRAQPGRGADRPVPRLVPAGRAARRFVRVCHGFRRGPAPG